MKAHSRRQPECITSSFCTGGTAQRTLNNSCSELQNLGLPYRLGLIGDLGQTENSAQTLEHLMANKPDSVLNVRDCMHVHVGMALPLCSLWCCLTVLLPLHLPLCNCESHDRSIATLTGWRPVVC